jgi:hypothetical protein
MDFSGITQSWWWNIVNRRLTWLTKIISLLISSYLPLSEACSINTSSGFQTLASRSTIRIETARIPNGSIWVESIIDRFLVVTIAGENTSSTNPIDTRPLNTLASWFTVGVKGTSKRQRISKQYGARDCDKHHCFHGNPLNFTI